MKRTSTSRGFTIVELLIVIVVIGILAAITIVAYNGIQQRGRDAQRKSDITQIAKAVELYYADNGNYPQSSGWCAQISDTSYGPAFKSDIQQYLSKIPSDPRFAGTNQDYVYGNVNDQSYYLYAELESSDRAEDNMQGCTLIGGVSNEFDYRYPSF
jgi:type II secretion system protein G